jgi:hypothetical protein
VHESLLLTCQAHGQPLIPGISPPGVLTCPEAGCRTAVTIAPLGPPGMPSAPLTPLAAQAAAHHELVLGHEAAGFSRTEAMQVLCAVIQAAIMRGSGDG